MEAGERRVARHGVPGPVAHAGSSRRDSVASGTVWPAEQARETRTSRTVSARQSPGARPYVRSWRAGVSASAADTARATVQQSAGAVSLSSVSATSRRASEIFGIGERASDRMPGVVFGTAALSESGSFHWLERGSAQTQPTVAGLQHTFSDFALGASATPGFPHSRPHGENRAARLATGVCASGVLAGDLHRPSTLQRHMLSRGQLAVAGNHYGPRS